MPTVEELCKIYNVTIDMLNGWEIDNPPTVEHFQFEIIDFNYWKYFIDTYWHYCFYIGGIYVVAIHILQRFMKNREPYDLRYFLFVWNVSLAMFSLAGFVRAIPPLLYLLLKDDGFYNSICVKRGINIPNVIWGLLFMASKIWELGDTVLLLLRKRPLVFLHWYHHLVTLIVTCSVGRFSEPILRWYAGLNFFVHIFMYSYFAVKSIGGRVPIWVARMITALQFTQMLIGVTVNLTSMYLKKIGYNCERHEVSIIAFSITYISFSILFGKLLYDSFKKTRRSTQTKNKME